MPTTPDSAILDLPYGERPDPDELVRAAMAWHFNPETGTPFWIERAKTLGFDPRTDITSFADLSRFPNVTDELRGVPVRDLIPRGFGPRPEVISVIESGGATGAPKRLPLTRPFADLLTAQQIDLLSHDGVPRDKDWLAILPSGPHGGFEQTKRGGVAYGALVYGVDLDPRWVRQQAAHGDIQGMRDYVAHIVDQVSTILADQNIGVIQLTPPLLAALSARDDLVDLINAKVDYIGWGGAHLDRESRHFYRAELFPDIRLYGAYGTTMALGAGASERRGHLPGDDCVFDPHLTPYVTFAVIDPETSQPVAYGERGQLVVHHVSKSFLLPNNAERDTAKRERPRDVGQIGDSIAEIAPLPAFGDTEVIEGVY
jgi:phenylacetate-coenzyme A ligase PaaK-like adenylate-forming protein